MKLSTNAIVITFALTTALHFSSAKAGLLSSTFRQVPIDHPTLAPIAFTRFCFRYADDCRVRNVKNSGEAFSASHLKDLVEVNRAVNQAIVPKSDDGGVLNERWRLSPNTGACHDYAVTKRHELLVRGWPSSALLLAEVVVPWGEHHLVLVVRSDKGDLVLDNLTNRIELWSETAYHWVRIQSASNPDFWSTVYPLSGLQVASTLQRAGSTPAALHGRKAEYRKDGNQQRMAE